MGSTESLRPELEETDVVTLELRISHLRSDVEQRLQRMKAARNTISSVMEPHSETILVDLAEIEHQYTMISSELTELALRLAEKHRSERVLFSPAHAAMVGEKMNRLLMHEHELYLKALRTQLLDVRKAATEEQLKKLIDEVSIEHPKVSNFA